MSRAAKTTPEERFEAFVRLAKRLKRAGRDSAVRDDYKTVGAEFGVAPGTLASWCTRYPEPWGKAQVAAGLIANDGSSGQDPGQDDEIAKRAIREKPPTRPPIANDAGGDEGGLLPAFMVVEGHQDPRVTPQQMRAIALDLGGSMTRQAIAAEVGVTPSTVSDWFNHNPAVQAVRDELQLEMVNRIRSAQLVVLHEGMAAQVDLARQVRLSARKGKWDPELQAFVPHDSEDLGRLARAAVAMTADAADRAGFPKTAISQHVVGSSDPHADLDQMTMEELAEEERRLEAMERRAEADVLDAEAVG